MPAVELGVVLVALGVVLAAPAGSVFLLALLLLVTGYSLCCSRSVFYGKGEEAVR